MGLDLLHFKGVSAPVNPDDFITVDAFPPEAFSELGFSELVQEVPGRETLHTVRFFADERTFEYAEASLVRDGYDPSKVTLLLGSPAMLDEQLRNIEMKLGLKRTDAWFSSTSRLDNGKKYSERFALYSRATVEKGIYYHEVGHQRKGMSDAFDSRYSREIYVDRAAFEDLEQCLWPDVDDAVRRNVRDHFIGAYEPGRSFLYISG